MRCIERKHDLAVFVQRCDRGTEGEDEGIELPVCAAGETIDIIFIHCTVTVDILCDDLGHFCHLVKGPLAIDDILIRFFHIKFRNHTLVKGKAADRRNDKCRLGQVNVTVNGQHIVCRQLPVIAVQIHGLNFQHIIAEILRYELGVAGHIVRQDKLNGIVRRRDGILNNLCGITDADGIVKRDIDIQIFLGSRNALIENVVVGIAVFFLSIQCRCIIHLEALNADLSSAVVGRRNFGFCRSFGHSFGGSVSRRIGYGGSICVRTAGDQRTCQNAVSKECSAYFFHDRYLFFYSLPSTVR